MTPVPDSDLPTYRDWKPGRYAVRFDRSHPATSEGSRIVVHTTTPFVADIGGHASPADDQYAAVGRTYLKALDDFLRTDGGHGLGLPTGWLDALAAAPAKQRPLQWLPIWPTSDAPSDTIQKPDQPLESWRLQRKATSGPGGGHPAFDTTIVLVAAEAVMRHDQVIPIGMAYGLRVPMVVLPSSGGGWSVYVRSMTAELPIAPYCSFTEVLAPRDPAINQMPALEASLQDLLDSPDDVLKAFDTEISSALQLEPGLSYDDFRLRCHVEGEVPVPDAIEVIGKGVSALERRPRRTSYSFVAYFTVKKGARLVLESAYKHRLTTNAVSRGSVPGVLWQDAPSWRDLDGLGHPPSHYRWGTRRPTRREKVLDAFRVPASNAPESVRPLEQTHFRVRNCHDFVPGDPDDTGTKRVTVPSGKLLPLRGNDLSAFSAYANCSRSYDLIAGFGIDLNTFVVAAEPELQVFYRSGITPGPGKDGRTVNAQVTIGKPEDNGFRVHMAPTISMHLAMGNLSVRARPIVDSNMPVAAEPLGIANDVRWMWHEFGHVLVASRLGQLEFDFVHSPGDALAAVACDPFSRLADARGGAPDGLRGLTFPFVSIPRRHDRNVTFGWSWGGTLNRPLLSAPAAQRRKRKGYIGEQILSSSLFRLYRILGGDTVRRDGSPAFAMRERASHVTLYLLIEAIRSLAQSPSSADALEAAMEDADVGLTSALKLDALSMLDPVPNGVADGWIGGRAGKVIRWAFEAQGMFAPDAQVDHNEPGKPPAVDVFIPDRRPEVETTGRGTVRHGAGGYVPVSLDWDGMRLWQRGPAEISGGPITIPLGNRGSQPATGLTLRAWVGTIVGDPADSGWDIRDQVAWGPGVGLIDLGIAIPGRQTTEVDVTLQGELPQGLAAGSGILLVEVSCADDRANSDPGAMLPTAIGPGEFPPTVPRHIADLVANDNNLALWTF